MKAGEAVRAIMEEKGVGTSTLADRIGKAPRLVCDRLRQDNISVDKLRELLRVMDYKIVIMPRSTALKGNEYEIE